VRVLALTHVFPRAVTDPQAPFLLTWAQALRAAGVQVGVVAPHDRGLPGAQHVGGVGVRLVRYAPPAMERLAYRGEMHQLATAPVGPPLVAALLTALAAAVRRQVRRAVPDVLHVHWWVPGMVAARLARVEVPTVVTVHGTDVALLETRPRVAALARWALAAADRVEAVSEDLAERLERTTGRRADAINPMPLDPAWLSAPPAIARGATDVLQVLAVGRMVHEKGFTDLLDAVARLPCPAEVTIVGDGPLRTALAARGRELGIPLTLPGRLAAGDLRREYAGADVVVQASRREGLGLVAAEAACAGTPVVATDSGGVRDVLPRSDLVAVGDVDGLAAALSAVAEDPAAAHARSAAVAVGIRQRLSPATAAARTLAGYGTLLGRDR
jgi:glycosyltransferase involved in cell wall biosynthesis